MSISSQTLLNIQTLKFPALLQNLIEYLDTFVMRVIVSQKDEPKFLPDKCSPRKVLLYSSLSTDRENFISYLKQPESCTFQ